jgi:hypothetical protein
MWEPSSVFGRYAEVVSAPSGAEGCPKSILLDFADIGECEENAGLEELENSDLCVDLDEDGQAMVQVAGEKIPITVTYNAKAQRYMLVSEALDRRYAPRTPKGLKRAETFTGLLNTEQAFRIIPVKPGIVYAHGYFFRPNLRFHNPDGESPILGGVWSVPALATTDTEKGEKIGMDDPKWRRESVFGLLHLILTTAEPTLEQATTWGQLGHDLASYEIVVCDDGGTEIADFIAINRTAKRIAFIHAKADRKGAPESLTGLQAVGRQAQASLAFCSSAANAPKIKALRWSEDLVIKKLAMNRTLRSSGMGSADLTKSIFEAITDRSWSREIWIVLGRILDRGALELGFNRAEVSNHFQQLGFYIEALRTSVGRANAQLKIFCPDHIEVRADVRPEQDQESIVEMA